MLSFTYIAWATVATLAVASPLEKRTPPFVGCNKDQTARLQNVFTQLSGYVLAPDSFLHGKDSNRPFDEKKKAYSHYFKPEDRDQLTSAFDAIFAPIIIGSYYNVRCADSTESDCSSVGSSSFAFVQPWPENFEVPDHVTKGQRQLVICPLFWEAEQTKRDIPKVDDKAAVDAFCKFKESKKYADWETGAHTLLHEITHLDEYGKAAKFPELTIPAKGPIPEFKAHGTDDWQGSTTAANARKLTNSKSKKLIPRWQNAESIAGFTLELMVSILCGVDDVQL